LQIVNGPDGDRYFTDQNSSRVRRFVSPAPRAAADSVGSSATATIGKRKRHPQIVRKRINP